MKHKKQKNVVTTHIMLNKISEFLISLMPKKQMNKFYADINILSIIFFNVPLM